MRIAYFDASIYTHERMQFYELFVRHRQPENLTAQSERLSATGRWRNPVTFLSQGHNNKYCKLFF